MTQPDNPYRTLPKVDVLANAEGLADLDAPAALRMAVAKEVIGAARKAIALGSALKAEDLEDAVRSALVAKLTPSLRSVVNATGVIVHTNLGRAPLPAAALNEVLGYSTLEYDLESGRRGSRRAHAAALLGELAGAEAALVVNNNAAAVVLMLAAHAAGGEVIISRGELIEIGGSFRVPEIMEVSGARLVEVGTTNKTYARDYEAAITSETRAILKVHPSNYRVTGFTHAPSTGSLAEVAARRGVPLLYDAGAATFGPLPQALKDVDVRTELSAGVDILSFSGDKILGGPQAGLLVGKQRFIDSCASHPLARALRADKMTLGALQYTLRAYVQGRADRIPVSSMVNATPGDLRRRAHELIAAIKAGLNKASLGAVEVGIVTCLDMVGGGSHPGVTIEGSAVTVSISRLDPGSAERTGRVVGNNAGAFASRLAQELRDGNVPVIAVIKEDVVRLHMRTISASEQPGLAREVQLAIVAALTYAPFEGLVTPAEAV